MQHNAYVCPSEGGIQGKGKLPLSRFLKNIHTSST